MPNPSIPQKVLPLREIKLIGHLLCSLLYRSESAGSGLAVLGLLLPVATYLCGYRKVKIMDREILVPADVYYMVPTGVGLVHQ